MRNIRRKGVNPFWPEKKIEREGVRPFRDGRAIVEGAGEPIVGPNNGPGRGKDEGAGKSEVNGRGGAKYAEL